MTMWDLARRFFFLRKVFELSLEKNRERERERGKGVLLQFLKIIYKIVKRCFEYIYIYI